MPQTFEDVIELLVPELQKRGLFWDDYCVPGGTYRENAYEIAGQTEPPPGHPAEALLWRPPGSRTNKNITNGADDHVEKTMNGMNGHAEQPAKQAHQTTKTITDPIIMQLS